MENKKFLFFLFFLSGQGSDAGGADFHFFPVNSFALQVYVLSLDGFNIRV